MQRNSVHLARRLLRAGTSSRRPLAAASGLSQALSTVAAGRLEKNGLSQNRSTNASHRHSANFNVPSSSAKVSTSKLTRRYSSSTALPPPTRDGQHPNLFYHALPEPDNGTLALSFLEECPVLSASDAASSDTIVSATVLGFLPLDPEAGLNDFVENRPFRTLLHTSIKAAIEAGQAKTVETEAMMRGSDGYLHIADERNLPPAGRIPEPEDILGSVYVEGGKLVSGTYEPQPMHRLVTADGVAVLPDGIAQHVLASLRKVLEEERKAGRGAAAGRA